MTTPTMPVHAAFELTGSLDEPALRRALDAEVRAQEALRSHFRELDGTAVRLVARPTAAVMDVLDLGDDELPATLHRLATTPVAADAAPLMRVTLLRLGPARAVLSVALHALIADELSPAVLIRRLACPGPRPARLGALLAGRTARADVEVPPVVIAFAVVMAAMTDTSEVRVGVVFRDEAAAGVVGPLAEVVPVRLVLDPAAPVGSVTPVLDPGPAPDAAVVISTAAIDLTLAGCRVRPLRDTGPDPSRRLTLHLTDPPHVTHDGTVEGADLVQDRVAAVLTALRHARSDDPVRGLFVLPAAERTLLSSWASGGDAADPMRSVPDLVAAAARATPDAPAVVAGDRVLTYGELVTRAAALADDLRGRGAGRETRIAICLPADLELPVALLAVLWAGGAYVPLDPSHPTGRIGFLVADSGARLVVTNTELAAKVPVPPRRTVLLGPDRPAARAGTAPVPVHPDQLAYVLHTSGSTGQPKGVMVTHRGFANYVSWAAAAYRLTEGSGSPLHSSIAFDLTITSLFPALVTGRTVVLAPEGAGVAGLAATLRTGGHSLVKLTPAHLALLGASLEPGELAAATRRLVVGGEALVAGALRMWTEHAPHTIVVNEYGPTEAVVGCCAHEVRAGQIPPGAVPIGRPIRGVRLYVLDSCGRRAPAGAVGELYIGGVGVARGYLGRPGQTAARFVPDPFGDLPGARLYRSGDLVRYRSDGVLEYLGRTDDQVKVRGHRVEPGEIEAALTRHPEVVAAAVRVLEDSVVAYLVPTRHLDAARLTEFLERSLPRHMLPARYVELPELPLTHNGKVDRAALPAPTVKSAADPRLVEDAELAAGLTPEGLPLADIHTPRHILLTGATGYLGAFLLARLLDTTDATVHCLVRADTATAARERLVATMRRYEVWADSYGTRVTVVPGALDRPRLGMSASDYERLAATVDVVHHCGAEVNFVFPYGALRAANVLGTLEVLAFACRSRAKAVHYLSTLDIALHGERPRVDEADPIDPADLVGGYDQTKWVAEQLVADVGTRGLPVVRYRPGTMLGHSRTGATNPADFSCVLLKGCVQLGIGPDHDLAMNLMPVDHVARVVAHLAHRPDAFGRVFHLHNPKTTALRDIWDWLRDFGYPLATVTDDRWRAELRHITPDNALYPVVPLLLRDDFVDPRAAGGDMAPVVGTANTDAATAGTGLDCPPLDGHLGKLILRHLVRVGFLPPP